ncbi:NACHT, LRR and PYD domains-containing 14-like [Paramuricea clavata]|uniref:NACHT, LRR and PYD domains-containing 14-like n=1 Tax=Paramuricea clavata TaxID=317549 RepID=A0A6S7FQD6_PARCT|nr:NACHT, LRR and PYD domains-containing 14-like [Paramuricea clavata]
MIDAVKEYLTPKSFGWVAYVCVIFHFLFGLALFGVVLELRNGEFAKFGCAVDKQSTAAYKTSVEKRCYSRYEQTYNTILPLYGFVLLSVAFTVLVSVIYAWRVKDRVEEVDRTSNESGEPTVDSEQTSQEFYVFYFYFFHLVVRSLFGILFTVLQHTVFYPRGFHFEFSCSLPTPDVTLRRGNNTFIGKSNNTLIACENSTASEKQLWSVIVSVLNTAFALIILGEVIYLWRQFPTLNCRSDVGSSSDTEFITEHLLRKRYVRLQLTTMDRTPDINIADSSTPNNNIEDSSTPDNSIADSSTPDNINFQDCTNYYKQQVLNPSYAPDICYKEKTDLNDMYTDVIIHTGRAQNHFSKEMDRHEIFDVYKKIPKSSIRLEKIKDLFYPNKDTKGNSPRSILAVGRPGIGKTVLTKKIIRDWANGIDEFYHDKTVFLYKFRWFNIIDELQNLSLKKFLRYGTGLSEEKFESIFEEILKEPPKAIFIFDGLDEFDGDLTNYLDQSRGLPNDPNMSGMTLFIKLAYGNLLQGATVLVTSRPTADHFYSRLNFDRNLEIIGFTSDKIEEYVSKFCDNIDRPDLKPRIWNHVSSSSDLLNLCYIPVNCFIVCVTLSGCLIHPRNDTSALPTTLTELYQTAIDHFAVHHNKNMDKTFSEQTLRKLQEFASYGIKHRQLVFNKESFDEQMKMSGLVNSLSNPIFPVQTQFCFIHLTIQEFLAAKHVTDTLPPDEIKKFISTHGKSGQWHLVLQFIAGILSKKMKMSSSDYYDCVSDFTKCLDLRPDTKAYEMDLSIHRNMFVMKCLRELDDEDIVKTVCQNTDLNLVTYISYIGGLESLSTSECVAITFVCKHLNNLKCLYLASSLTEDDCFLEVSKLLQQSCLEVLSFRNNKGSDLAKEQITSALMRQKCTLNHEHVKLTHLHIGMTEECVSNMCAFIKNGHASHLQRLKLSSNFSDTGTRSSKMSKLCEALNEVPCPELTYLDLGSTYISDEGVDMLCNALIKGRLCKLNMLILKSCSLTEKSMHSLCKALYHEHCKLSQMNLSRNAIGDEGVNIFFNDAVRRDQCEVTYLQLGSCSLTVNCILPLCKALQDKHCKLTWLSLSNNAIGDEGVRMLCTDALRREQCKLTQLDLENCSLTDECLPLLCKTLQDGHCKLNNLSLGGNNFTEEGKKNFLCNVARTECCKSRGLQI